MHSGTFVAHVGRSLSKWPQSVIVGRRSRTVNPAGLQSTGNVFGADHAFGGPDGAGGRHVGGARAIGSSFITGILVSILTKLKLKFVSLFTYLSSRS